MCVYVWCVCVRACVCVCVRVRVRVRVCDIADDSYILSSILRSDKWMHIQYKCLHINTKCVLYIN